MPQIRLTTKVQGPVSTTAGREKVRLLRFTCVQGARACSRPERTLTQTEQADMLEGYNSITTC